MDFQTRPGENPSTTHIHKITIALSFKIGILFSLETKFSIQESIGKATFFVYNRKTNTTARLNDARRHPDFIDFPSNPTVDPSRPEWEYYTPKYARG